MSADQENYVCDMKMKINLAAITYVIGSYSKKKLALLKNVLKDNRDFLDTLLPEIGDPGLSGKTLLHIAAERSDKTSFDFLLEEGADFTMLNTKGETVIHQSLKIIDESKTIDQLWRKLYNPFIESVLSAHMKTGNSINPSDVNGLTHFHVACMLNHVGSAQFFLNSGVSVHMMINRQASSLPGYSPLHLAVRYCAYEVVELLLKYGANLNAQDAEGMTPLHLLMKQSIRISDYLNTCMFDLLEVELCCYQKMSALFIEHLIHNDLFIIDDNGFTCLDLACMLNNSHKVEYFLQLGYNVNDAIKIDSPIFPGYTALHFAAHYNKNTLMLLVRWGGDIARKDAVGCSPFDIFLRGNNELKYLHVLIDSQLCWKDLLFNDGRTKLIDFLSVMQSESNLYAFLCSTGINVRLDKQSPLWPGYTLLHLLAEITASRNITQDLSEYRGNEMNYSMPIPSCRFTLFEFCNEHGADFDVQDLRGRTPLHLAFYLGDVRLIKILLKCLETNSNPVDNYGISHLHIACIFGDDAVFARLLKSEHIDVNKKINVGIQIQQKIETKLTLVKGSTPLHLAITVGYFDMAQELLKHGAKIAIQDNDGLTPLHRLFGLKLTNSDETEVHKLMLPIFSFKNKNELPVVDCGLTHLHVAIYCNNLPAIKKLLDLGENIDSIITCHRQENWLSSLSRVEPYDGYSPLRLAIAMGNNECVKILLRRGADVLPKNTKVIAPIYEVLKEGYNNTEIQKQFVNLLQFDTKLQNRVLKNSGLTMLHVACAIIDVELVKYLCHRGKNVNARLSANSSLWPGSTPLHVLMITSADDRTKVDEITNILTQYGADVTITNCYGNTPIHENFNRCNIRGFRVSRRLLRAQKDFSVNPANIEGISHFHIACACKDVIVVEKFIEHGADIHLRAGFYCNHYGGFTPLHFACLDHLKNMWSYLCVLLVNFNYIVRNWQQIFMKPFPMANVDDYLKTVDLLLERGANVNAIDRIGNTPFHTALISDNPHISVCHSLVRRGARLNGENFFNEAPIEWLLSYGKGANVKLLKFLLHHGCKVNIYSYDTKEGLIPKIISKNPYLDVAIVDNLCQAIDGSVDSVDVFDEMERSFIHNIVSHSGKSIRYQHYVKSIDAFARIYPEINYEDNEANTPLHTAIHFRNWEAVSALLDSGADINLLRQGDSAIDILYQELDRTSENIMFKCISMHIYKLNLCHIQISSVIRRLGERINAKLQIIQNEWQQPYSTEMESTKNVKIGSSEIVFHRFLSETGVIFHHRLSKSQRDIIQSEFKYGSSKLRGLFPNFYGIMKLQFSKAFDRKVLLDYARIALSSVLRWEMPYLCSEAVLYFLSNADLENLNVSVNL